MLQAGRVASSPVLRRHLPTPACGTVCSMMVIKYQRSSTYYSYALQLRQTDVIIAAGKLHRRRWKLEGTAEVAAVVLFHQICRSLWTYVNQLMKSCFVKLLLTAIVFHSFITYVLIVHCPIRHKPHSDNYKLGQRRHNFKLSTRTNHLILAAISFNAGAILTVINSSVSISFNQLFYHFAFCPPHNTPT